MKTEEDRKGRLLGFHVAEPPMLRRVVLFGILVVILGFSASVLVGVNQGLWNFNTYTEEMESKTLCCATQHNHRRMQLKALQRDKDLSLLRLELLQTALENSASPHFVFARANIIEERAQLKKIDTKINNQQVTPLSWRFVIIAALVIVLVLLTALAAAHLMLLHGGEAVLSRKKIESWCRPYWIFVAIVFLPWLVRELYTSVIPIDKSSFGWNSFCVSNAAWVLAQVMFLGFAMVIVYPGFVLWYLSRQDYRPGKLDHEHPDGSWGVKKYVLFLQTWSILSGVLFLIPTLLALRIYAGSSFLYAVPSIIYSAILCVIVGRLIWNAVMIRQLYERSLREMGTTWQEIKSHEPPGDPTINFLGEHWWKLPATILGALAVFWALIEWSGVITRF